MKQIKLYYNPDSNSNRYCRHCGQYINVEVYEQHRKI